MFKLKQTLKNNNLTKSLYYKMKKLKDNQVRNNKLKYTGKFINRSNNSEYLCIVLAGYKEFFYPAFFGRLKKFMDSRLDVCIITSGKYSKEIEGIAEKNEWSYLSTEENNVALVQNVAINLHKKAKYIFKLDEDILITENYFDHMLQMYEYAKKSDYYPGVIAPILPINGYGHMVVLEKLHLLDIYENKFEKPKYMAGPSRMIENSSEVAKFFWGEGGYVKNIDELNLEFWKHDKIIKPCPIRFSIGAILFERELWESMGYFNVNRKITALGADELQLCNFCCNFSRPIMVSENIVVGHLSFGPQNAVMKDFYYDNNEKFVI